jgi:hypothetical protein
MRLWKKSWRSLQTNKNRITKNGQVQLASETSLLPTILLYFMRQRRKSPRTHNNAKQSTEAKCLHEGLNALRKAYFWECPKSAVCVQLSIDSRNSASHNAYRTLLRPSSISEPRDPSLCVVRNEMLFSCKKCGFKKQTETEDRHGKQRNATNLQLAPRARNAFSNDFGCE